MKPAVFEYSRPADLDEACAMLAEGDDARLIAGGQTLVPLMAMRLARPNRLIDIARIGELAFVRREGDAIAIGATTKQCAIEREALIRAEVPLLAKIMPFVGHAPIRARGTLGGSLANADPAAEIALVAVTLGATLSYRDGTEAGEIAAAEFFTGPMTTALSPSACLTCVRFPVWRDARIGVGFHEVNARKSDFAFASAAAQIAFDENGVCRRLALGIGAVTPIPLRLDALGRILEGHALEGLAHEGLAHEGLAHEGLAHEGLALAGTHAAEIKLREAVAAALADIDPLSDLHASAEYRRRAATSLLIRAIADACRAAKGRAPHAP
jgi:CO/xanthine dehydrogenase FAD-binding subunit